MLELFVVNTEDEMFSEISDFSLFSVVHTEGCFEESILLAL